MPATTSTRTLPPQPSSLMSTVPRPRPLPRPLFKKTKPPVTPPHVRVPPPVQVIEVEDAENLNITPSTPPIESNFQVAHPKMHYAAAPQSSRSVTAGTPRKGPQLQSDVDTWDLAKLGPYVWVLIDRSARVLDPEVLDGPKSYPMDRLWWPGKIRAMSSTDSPLKVRLFGVAAPGVKSIEIHGPCQSNIISLENSQHRLRFDSPTFVDLGRGDGNIHASPRKKQKHDRGDVQDRWRAALEELVNDREQEEGSDAMPEVGTLDFSLLMSTASPAKSIKETTSPAKGKLKGKRKRRDSDSENEEDDYEVDVAQQARWSPPPEDESLQIPGELLLAVERATATEYWPARIMSYVPPKNARQEPKYRVEFLDSTEKDIPRKWFYTSDEDEFATCKLGMWESEYKEVQNDEDDEDANDPTNNRLLRFPSPIPTEPPPNAVKFRELSIREQFAYTKPILSAILNEKYTPALACHIKFIAGGVKRKNVVDDAILRGRMDPEDVSTLQENVSEWCLRDEARAQEIVDEENGEGVQSMAEAADVVEIVGVVPDVEALPRRALSPAGSQATLALSQSEVPPASSFTTELQDVEPPSMSIAGMSDSVADSLHSADLGEFDDQYVPPPRQRGCDAYEGLSRVEKVDYCLNVLLPEAILQILLWRAEQRHSIELLSDAEEALLHDKGRELLQERDWVNDIMRLRESMRRKADKNRAGKVVDGEVYSVTGRLKRSAGAPKSYRE